MYILQTPASLMLTIPEKGPLRALRFVRHRCTSVPQFVFYLLLVPMTLANMGLAMPPYQHPDRRAYDAVMVAAWVATPLKHA